MNPNPFVVGQRWASHTEPQLGLGIVTESINRRVKILFPASEESRVYATDNAPLSRIIYSIGDTVADMDDQQYEVLDIHIANELITYTCNTAEQATVNLDEIDLSCFVKFSTPQQRLFSGQIDKAAQYELRIDTLQHIHKLQQSATKGLQGSRTNLLPHQIYIANEVAQRHAPRVLLADEVGLGKTIEAGMILHHQILTGIASRALILVPDSLLHQWLVEMLRRFNLHFSIYDQARIEECLESDTSNPFEQEQFILCPLSLLTQNNEYLQLSLQTQWDMLIVDEAHHLVWADDDSGHAYRCVEQLTHVSQGVLLLTATPEQVGLDNHFARLRLLDPARFHDVEKFRQEQASYTELNALVENIQNENLDAEQTTLLTETLGDTTHLSKDEIISQLLDRHGTGRVLFRNTRNAIKGFPKRLANAYALDAADNTISESRIEQQLYPETNNKNWLDQDARLPWLIDTLKELRQEKVLLICHHAETAIALDKHLNLRAGIRSASFYEGLSIIERDRAAAYFAEGSQDDDLDSGVGAQVLICSEIGSEGRNFQFAHHLILFDLPLNPDLLEQRIGRLDRIGQNHDIQIHIPYFKNTAQEFLVNFYHEGMQLFERSCASAFSIYQYFQQRLEKYLKGQADATFIADVKTYTDNNLAELQAGRDRLLELNSCKPDIANDLIDKIHALESDDALPDYMDQVFNHFGVDSEFHSTDALILQASDHMQSSFPYLKEEGTTITFSRNKALSRENMEFLSWEHPMVHYSLEAIINENIGNTHVASCAIKSLPKGLFFIECYFTLQSIAPKALELDRYLPSAPFRVLLGSNNKIYTDVLTREKLSPMLDKIPSAASVKLVQQLRDTILQLIDKTQILVNKQQQQQQALAEKNLDQHLHAELQRLIALQKVNPSVRDDEINFIKEKINTCKAFIQRADYQLQALRIVINNY